MKNISLNFFCVLCAISLCIELTACNNGNTAQSSSSSAIVAAPTNLQAHAGYPAVTLTWGASASAGAESYNLYLATQAGVSSANWNQLTDGEVIHGANSPYSHTRVYKDVTYYYVVTAVKNGVESAPSSEASDPNTYIFDDFERPDQQLGGTTPTGQSWSAGGPGSLTYGIVSGRMVTVQNVYPRLPYPRHDFRFGSSFSFDSSSSNDSSIVLIADGGPQGGELRNMVHFQIRKNGWGLIYRADIRTTYTAAMGDTVFSYPFNSLVTQPADFIVRVNGVVKTLNTDYTVTGIGNAVGGTVIFNQPMSGGEAIEIGTPGPFENILGGSQVLAADGTIYSASMTIIGDTVILELPDGTVQKATDSRIQSITGNSLIWQLTDGGCRNESVYATSVSN